MPDYRIYRIEEDGRIAHLPIVITCATDEEAIERARDCVDGLAVELWRRDRLIRRFGPEK
jgi:hypothetical protein